MHATEGVPHTGRRERETMLAAAGLGGTWVADPALSVARIARLICVGNSQRVRKAHLLQSDRPLEGLGGRSL